MLNPLKVRSDFPIFANHREKPLLYLDNAASSQKPQCVIDAECNFYSNTYANVHRSPHELGAKATDLFEGARTKAAKFIGVDDIGEFILVRGTTEAINLLATIASGQILKEGDVVLVTMSEHHANIIPWQLACARTGAKLEYVNLHGDGVIDLEEVRRNWNPKVKIFAFQHCSNVLGTTHPVKELCDIARENGAISIVDGAQSVPHTKVDVKAIGCDFFAFSAHKMCGPTGVGALYGRREILESLEPVFGGGEMILRVQMYSATWNELPFKFEAGTPSIASTVGWGAAIDYMENLGMDNIEEYVKEISNYAVEKLSQIEGLTIYGPQKGRVGPISFDLKNVHPHDIASVLDYDGICVRAGHHCAQPLMNWLEVVATARASFYIYNTKDEVDALANSLEKAKKVLGNGF